MKFYAPFAKVDDEARRVEGYASTEALDSQNEIVKREALKAALEPYMKFANIREMHGPSAVGVAHAAEIDDKGLRLGATIVDPVAWEKVKAGVYKGFSIGGHVTARDPQQRHIITGLTLNEISLVDRPANPEALFDVWKADFEADALTKIEDLAKLNAALSAENRLLKAEIETLKSLPQPMKGKILSIDKAQDFQSAAAYTGPVTLPHHHQSWFTTRA